MALLEKYPHETMPNNCYDQVMYLWILTEDNVIEKVERDTEAGPCTHSDQWGEDVWGNDRRGYYFPDAGIVTCHATFGNEPKLIDRLAKVFKDAMYYYR